jgi:DNA (cytosine-5)-methyltransferase 1
VLNHHYPIVPNYGDMTKYEEWPNESIDLLVGGTPCQSFSVAGLSQRACRPQRQPHAYVSCNRSTSAASMDMFGKTYPVSCHLTEDGILVPSSGRWASWGMGSPTEFSTLNGSEWPSAAVAVFVVGYLGDWQRPAKVLFESESVRRDTPPSREARKATSDSPARCFAGNRQSDVAATLETTAHD